MISAVLPTSIYLNVISRIHAIKDTELCLSEHKQKSKDMNYNCYLASVTFNCVYSPSTQHRSPRLLVKQNCHSHTPSRVTDASPSIGFVDCVNFFKCTSTK